MVVKENPVNTGRKLNVYTMLCAFNLCPVSTGNPDKYITKMDQICPFRHFFDPYPPDSCPSPITTKTDPYVEHHAIYVNLSLKFCDDLLNVFGGARYAENGQNLFLTNIRESWLGIWFLWNFSQLLCNQIISLSKLAWFRSHIFEIPGPGISNGKPT